MLAPTRAGDFIGSTQIEASHCSSPRLADPFTLGGSSSYGEAVEADRWVSSRACLRPPASSPPEFTFNMPGNRIGRRVSREQKLSSLMCGRYWVAALLPVTSRFPSEKRAGVRLPASHRAVRSQEEICGCLSVVQQTQNQPKYLFLTGQPMQWRVRQFWVQIPVPSCASCVTLRGGH